MNIVKGFLYEYFKDITAELTGDWVSYDVQIGTSGETIRPWSIMEVTTVPCSLSNAPVGMKSTPTEFPWLALAVLGPCQLSRISDQAYAEDIKKRIVIQMKALGSGNTTFPSSSAYEGWTDDENYCKMAGTIDMFFHHFPNHPLSRIRIATLSTRFRDCSGLTSVGFITGILSLKDESEFLDWVFTEQIGMELLNMFHEMDDAEMVKDESYFHYQSDLRIVKRTWYSAVKNPNLFVVVHFIGSLMGIERSKNARMWYEDNITNNVCMAKILAYVFSRYADLSKVFKEKNTAQVEMVDHFTDIGGEPQGLNATEWFLYFQGLNWKLPQNVEDFIAMRVSKIGTVRSGTVGEYVSRNF